MSTAEQATGATEELSLLSIANEANEVGKDSDNESNNEAEAEAGKKKKKNKKRTKKKKKAGLGAAGQTDTLSVPVSQLFPVSYPEGEICEYTDDNRKRTTDEEMRAKDRLNEKQIFDLRRAAEVHRQVRRHAQRVIRPGMDLTTIADMIENGTRTLVEANGFESGIGFPTGLSINHCAAHYTPNAGDH
ncbi:Methionine aminopeptidase 2, partial [Coemansia sp. RSA 1287]